MASFSESKGFFKNVATRQTWQRLQEPGRLARLGFFKRFTRTLCRIFASPAGHKTLAECALAILLTQKSASRA